MSSSTRLSIFRAALRRPRILIAGCGLVVIAVALLIQHALIKSRTDARLATISEKGLPITLTELNDSYSLPTDATNAASFYEKAFTAFIRFDMAHTNAPVWHESTLGKAYPPGIIDFLDQWVATNRRSLKLVHEGAKQPACRFQRDYTASHAARFHSLDEFMPCVRLLCWDAYLKAESGDMAGSIDSLSSAIAIIDSVAKIPEIYAQRLGMGGLAHVAFRLEEILNRHQITDEQLTSLSRLFKDRETTANLRSAHAGEMCKGLDILETPFQQGSPLKIRDRYAKESTFEKIMNGATLVLLKATGLWGRNRELFVDVYARYINALEMPFPAALRETEAAEEYANSQSLKFKNVIAGLLLHWTPGSAQREAQRIAILRTTQTAIAIQRYRLAHDDDAPMTLDQLTPVYLPSVLTDPFDGEPLRYRRLKKGFVVYSIGRDGKEQQRDPESRELSSDDLRFRILR